MGKYLGDDSGLSPMDWYEMNGGKKPTEKEMEDWKNSFIRYPQKPDNVSEEDWKENLGQCGI